MLNRITEDFWFDGINAYEKGVRFQRQINFSAPEPNVDQINIPGGKPALIWDGTYKNVTGSASCFCYGMDAASVVTAINAWIIAGADGYKRLETKTEPTFYRLARIVHGAQLEPRLNRINPFEIEFDCLPQKYYKSGEREINLTGAATLYNPSGYPAKPLITLTGSGAGTLTVGGKTLTLTDCDGVVLDFEEETAAKNGVYINSTVSGEYTVLGAETQISFSGGITGVSIIPRWWTI